MTRRAAIFLTLLISLMAGISNGNVLGLFEDRVVTNAYDRAYRLVTETAAETGGSTVTTSYVHDKANNRTEKIVAGGSNPGTWSFAHGTTADGYNSNQVKSVTKGATVTTFLYDLNGNRTEKKVGGTTVQTYGFDRENRLTSLTDSAKGTFSYSYDHRTRRVGRDETGASGTEDEVSFAGGLSVQEYIGGSGTPTVEYVRGSDYGGGIGGVLYTIRDDSARSYNAYNSRGDVVSKTDQAGVITWQSSYEAFGTRTQEQGSTDDRQKANTKDEDPTGLLNEGMRYRDLEFGIFLTRDPAGFVDGPNVYTYVRQNPWTSFDPLGLYEVEGGGVSNEWIDKSHAIQANPNPSFGDSMKAMAYGIAGAVRIIPEATSYAFNGARTGMAEARADINQKIDSGEMNPGVGVVARVGLFTGDFAVGTSELINAPHEGVPNTVNGLKNLPGKVVGDVKEFAQDPSLSGALDLVEDAGTVSALGKTARGISQGKVSASKTSDGARVMLGPEGGTQLSFNAYFNNAAIAKIYGKTVVPGVGVNVLKGGARVKGLEIHRFNAKGTNAPSGAASSKGPSVVRPHRHSGETPSQIKKHRKIFSDETY